MARFVVLFMMGCAVGLFAVVFKMTRPSPAFSSTKEAQVTESTTAPRSGKKPRPQTANSKKKDGAAGVYRSSVESNESRGIRTPVPSSKSGLNAFVTSDSAPVFQSNSTNSTLLESLKRGDEVKIVLEIVDSKGAWTLIKAAGRSGYVPSEMLERKTPAKQARQ